MIAVIIPHRNAGEWLERCLDSVDPRFKVITIDDNVLELGVSGARTQGIKEAFDAGADYITFLDADDTMEANAYDQILAAIEEAQDAPVIQLNHRRMNKDGGTWIKYYNHKGNYELGDLPGFWVAVWNKIYKASFIKQLGVRFKPGLQHGEDELFNLECLAKCRRIYCSERIAVVHHFDNDKSLSRMVTRADLYAEQVALLEFLDDNNEDPELCEVVVKRQAELWHNKCYMRTFAGGLK